MSADAVEEVVQRIKRLTVEERVELERRVRPLLSPDFQEAAAALEKSMDAAGITDAQIDDAVLRARYDRK
jgi:hypothetical protein